MASVSVAPTIDKGAGGSKSVKVIKRYFLRSWFLLGSQLSKTPLQVNRMTVWRINVKGEPPPAFSWWKVGQQELGVRSQESGARIYV